MRNIATVGIVAFFGCNAAVDQPTSQATYAVGKVVSDPAGTFKVAVTSPKHASRLDEVLGVNPPTGFRWIVVVVEGSNSSQIESGFKADMSKGSSSTTFIQSYEEVCNPRLNDYSECWFTERLNSGGDGVSGVIDIRRDPSSVTAAIDVTYEGDTTIFGDPPSYYKHGTLTGFTASLRVEGGE